MFVIITVCMHMHAYMNMCSVTEFSENILFLENLKDVKQNYIFLNFQPYSKTQFLVVLFVL